MVFYTVTSDRHTQVMDLCMMIIQNKTLRAMKIMEVSGEKQEDGRATGDGVEIWEKPRKNGRKLGDGLVIQEKPMENICVYMLLMQLILGDQMSSAPISHIAHSCGLYMVLLPPVFLLQG